MPCCRPTWNQPPRIRTCNLRVCCDLAARGPGDRAVRIGPVHRSWRRPAVAVPLASLRVPPGRRRSGRHSPSQWLYIRAEDKPAYDARLRRGLDHLLQHGGIPPAERFGVLIDAVGVQLQTAFQRIHIDETVAEAARIGGTSRGW